MMASRLIDTGMTDETDERGLHDFRISLGGKGQCMILLGSTYTGHDKGGIGGNNNGVGGRINLLRR